jgi:hypothetical protein
MREKEEGRKEMSPHGNWNVRNTLAASAAPPRISNITKEEA